MTKLSDYTPEMLRTRDETYEMLRGLGFSEMAAMVAARDKAEGQLPEDRPDDRPVIDAIAPEILKRIRAKMASETLEQSNARIASLRLRRKNEM